MMAEAERLISEIKQIKAQYVAEVGSGRRAWPRSIKERVASLDELGVPIKSLAGKCDIPYDTMILWRYKRKREAIRQSDGFHELTVGAQAQVPAISKSGTVTVTKSKISTTTPASEARLRLTTRSGLSIEGLDVESVMTLLARLEAPGGIYAF